MFISLSEELKLSSSLCFGTVSWVIDNRAMVLFYLGLWVFLLGCSPSQLHGQVILGKGEVCGGAVEGQCDTNLTCVSVKPADKEQTPSAGLCSRESTCYYSQYYVFHILTFICFIHECI